MASEVKGTSPTPSSRFDRRTVLKSAAAGVAATSLATVSKRSTFAAPAFHQSTTIVFAVGADDVPKIQPLIDDYASANNVTVEMQGNPFASLLEKLTLNLTQATGAYDVVSMDDPWMPQFAGGEFLMNLEELMDQQGMAPDEDFVPELLALGDYPPGTGLRGIPWIGNVQVFAWRTDILEDMGMTAPKTWDDVLSVAQTVTDTMGADGLYGIGLRGKAGNDAATSFLPVLRGYGTDLFDENWEPQLETPEAMAAMTTHLALAKLAPPGVENTDHAQNGTNMFEGIITQSGDIWPDQLLQIYDPELSKVVGKVDIGGEPAQEGVAPANMTGNWLLGIPEGSQNAEAALDFIMWFTAPEQQLRLLLDQNIPATRTSVLENPEAVEKLPFLPGLLAAGRNALPRPRTPLYNAVEAIYGRFVAEAIAGQVSGEEALASANTEIRDLMVREGVLQQ
ncbi:MAG: extracellular solute-binding protein [Chloroflexota bacterium]|nr:extracellular solute-binding protein [Chloroflexia bacterium]MDQ3227413.1 extracellular solute-binding protein [Chloroflexota bacterium]